MASEQQVGCMDDTPQTVMITKAPAVLTKKRKKRYMAKEGFQKTFAITRRTPPPLYTILLLILYPPFMTNVPFFSFLENAIHNFVNKHWQKSQDFH